MPEAWHLYIFDPAILLFPSTENYNLVEKRSERRIDYKQKVSFLDKASYQETDTDIGPNRVEDDAHIEMPEDMQQIAQKQ
uniref:Uncharacterized protein n=1 Tax=Wuchereria bancrofti TaxID=6293 RepID=A0A1I8EM13_WUCBA